MKVAGEFYVFDKWRSAPPYAFGSNVAEGVVPIEDREAYWSIYSELCACAEEAVAAYGDEFPLVVRPKPYSRERGSRGHRPVDLYVSICGSSADVLGWYPQVYAIASHRGLEVGFAASISEDDYFDANAKIRNRSIVPFINSKLPGSTDLLVAELDQVLSEQGGWHLNAKTRLSGGVDGFDTFASAGALLDHLKASGDIGGGGVIARVFPLASVPLVDLPTELWTSLNNFVPLLARCAPSPWDVQVRMSQLAVEDAEGTPFDPSGVEDGRQKILTAVARRQGQAKFRAQLLDAYEAKCAITRTAVPDVLQAAHITPYLGPGTNHVTNGLLLRADLHTLFDLGLLRVNPNSLEISVSPALKDSNYWSLEGTSLFLPQKPSQRPSSAALAAHFNWAAGT
jgi:hypothetical protein